MLHQLPHHAIPLPRFGIASTVFSIGDEVEEVVEPHLLGDALQHVHTKTVKAPVSRVIFFRMHHDVGHFLNENFIKHMHMQLR